MGLRKVRNQNAPARWSSSSPQKRTSLVDALWVAPALLLVVGLIYFSIMFTVWLSLHDWNGVGPIDDFVGFDNYRQALSSSFFWSSLGRMLILGIAIPVSMALGLLVAVLLQTGIRGAWIYRSVFFFPVVLSPAVTAPVFRDQYGDKGFWNNLLTLVGLEQLTRPWLAEPRYAIWVLALIAIWGSVGFSMVIYSAALTQLDKSVLEAARIDGAGGVRIFRSIIVPMTKGSSLVLLLLGLIGLFKTFDMPFLVTGGGPARSTEILGLLVYREGIKNFDAGLAAALTVVLFALALAITPLLTHSKKD